MKYFIPLLYITIFTLLVVSMGRGQASQHVTANIDVNNSFTGTNQFSMPIYLTAGTATSQTNECASVTTDSSTGTAAAVAVFRSIKAGVGHDLLCIITADSVNPSNIGSMVFPGITSFSPNSAASQLGPGTLEQLGPTGGRLIFTNNGGTNRTNGINFRACNGPGPTACGTDLNITEDFTGAGKEELQFVWGGDGTPFYTGNVLNSQHPGIYLGGCCADTSAPFGFDRYLGKLSHMVRLGSDTDIWGTLTLSSGTVSLTFNRAFASPPICTATWQSGTLTGMIRCATTTTGMVISSTGGTDNATIGYVLWGNNN